MRKKILGFLLLVCILFGRGSEISYAQSQEQCEEIVETERIVGADNTSFNTAVPISIGTTRNDTITETVRERLYRINLVKSGCLAVNITSYMTNYCIYVYDSTGEMVWKTENNIWNENLKYCSDGYTIDLTAGNYYMKVTGYRYGNSYASTGNYSFTTSFTDAQESCAETNNDFAHTSLIQLNSTIRGQIAENDRYDIYQFSLGAAGRINLEMTSYMKYYIIYVYDFSGNEIWYTDNNMWNENLKYRSDKYTIDLTAGNYYMKVTGYRYGNSYASTGNYTFTTLFTNAEVSYTEPNNDFSTAYPLGMNTVVKGQIAENDRYDIFRFTLNESMDIAINMVSYMKNYVIHIYDFSGNEIWYTDNNPWNENVGYREDTYKITLSAGNYYIKVTGYRYGNSYASTGTYTLTLNSVTLLDGAKIKKISDKTYAGKAICPSVTVTYNGNTLQQGIDYTVSYENNGDIGVAKAVVEGIGNYSGTKSINFKIVPRKASLKSVKRKGKSAVMLSWKKDSFVSGYDIYRSIKKSSKYKRIVSINYNTTVKYQDSKLKRGKTYYYKIRAYKYVNGKKMYGDYSQVKSVKMKK